MEPVTITIIVTTLATLIIQVFKLTKRSNCCGMELETRRSESQRLLNDDSSSDKN